MNQKAIISYRIEKAYNSLKEAKAITQLGFWRLIGDRLYYAAFYMASALLLDQGLIAKIQAGWII